MGYNHVNQYSIRPYCTQSDNDSQSGGHIYERGTCLFKVVPYDRLGELVILIIIHLEYLAKGVHIDDIGRRLLGKRSVSDPHSRLHFCKLRLPRRRNQETPRLWAVMAVVFLLNQKTVLAEQAPFPEHEAILGRWRGRQLVGGFLMRRRCVLGWEGATACAPEELRGWICAA